MSSSPEKKPDSVLPDKEDIINMNNELSASERHFNQLQANYRMMAAGWLAAAFTGIGFVLEKNTAVGPLQPLFINGLIALMGSLGILLAWNLDLRVYHTLLDAVFISGIQLENEHPWLPQVRNNMMKLNQRRGILHRVVWFYLLGWLLLAFTGGAFFTLRLYIAGSLFTWPFLFVYLLLLLGGCRLIYRSTRETHEMAGTINRR